MLNNKYQKSKKPQKNGDPFVIRSGKYKDSKIESVYRSGWSEDTYISETEQKETVGKNFNVAKLPIIGLVFFVLLMVLLTKVAWLQIVKGEYYYSMAEGNRVRVERIEPKRGVIYDREMRPLVRNRANFLLYFIPADLYQRDLTEMERNDIFNTISNVLGNFTAEELSEKLAEIDKYSLESYQPLFITDHIEYEKAMQLYIASANWPGVILTNKTNRDYLVYGFKEKIEEDNYLLSLSHIMGYTGKINDSELEQYGAEYLPIDYIGKMGIEYFWENELKGESGKKQIEVDALGKESKIMGQTEPQHGHNLVLSLDTMLQLKLEEILTKHLSKLKLSRASATLLNPQNGEILALVSLPAFNNNAFARGISHEDYELIISHPDKPLFNRTISGEYPSGSTIKPVWSSAALEEGIITEHTSFLSVGGIRIGEWYFPDWRAGGHGRTNVRRAIAESVNTFFYYIGGGHDDFRGLGLERMINYGEQFGLGTQTGVDLAGEASGFLPTRSWKEEVKNEPWYIGDTYHMAIGQGDLLVTPLQVALFTSVFANGGSLYRPHFIKQVLSSSDEILEEVVTDPIRKDFIDPGNIEIIRQGMRQTVTSGSARSMQILSDTVAGKTGTAQWSSNHETHAWFTGFAPYEDAELVITILIEEGGEGSETAVPVAREFLAWYFDEYKKPEEEKRKINLPDFF